MFISSVLLRKFPEGRELFWKISQDASGKQSVWWDENKAGRPCPTLADMQAWATEGPTLEEARAAKLAEINTKYSTVMAYIQAGYPPEEILSWERQSTQAQALQQNPEAAAAFVRGLAATKGVEVEEMAQRILANAASWEPIAALLTGQRQAMEECAWAAQTVVALGEIKVSYSV